MAQDSGARVDDAVGKLERYRAYLSLLARLHLRGVPESKLDLSGIVQETLWQAHRALGLREVSCTGLGAWLRTMLLKKLRDESRKVFAKRRDASRDRSIEEQAEESSDRLLALLASDVPSPEELAMREEEVLHLAAALEQLPPDQRQAVELHHLAGMPVAEVAAKMGRSRGAVGQLLVRGLRRLRWLLRPRETGP